MAGHNRWTKIKRQKQALGATKGRLFTKVIRELTVSAREGGPDPDGNPRLRAAIAAAKEANLPKENLERAIQRGTGELEGAAYEEVAYEGYGPGGVAVLVECVTDNRNRTAGEVRHLFDKGGGSLEKSGSVSWIFERKAVMEVYKERFSEEEVMEVALEVGAEDVLDGEEAWEVRAESTEFHVVLSGLEAKGLSPTEAKLAWLPKSTVKVEGDAAKGLMKMLSLLEDCDDVQNVWANYEIDDAELEAAIG